MSVCAGNALLLLFIILLFEQALAPACEIRTYHQDALPLISGLGCCSCHVTNY